MPLLTLEAPRLAVRSWKRRATQGNRQMTKTVVDQQLLRILNFEELGVQ